MEKKKQKKTTNKFSPKSAPMWKSDDGELWETQHQAEEVNVCLYLKKFIEKIFESDYDEDDDDAEEEFTLSDIQDKIYRNLPAMVQTFETVKSYAKQIQKSYTSKK